MRVAIFDFDGTIYSNETYQLLMEHLKEHPVYSTRYKHFMRLVLPPYIGNKMKVYPKQRMKNRSMKVYLEALKGLSITELDEYFEEVAEKMHADLNQEVVAKLYEHAEDGIHIMIVSGAYTPLLHIVTKEMPVDAIIGTDIPVNRNILNTRVSLNHVQGTHKNDQIEAALAGQDIDWENSYAYADSLSDLTVLELVGNPVAVNPESKLQAIAKKREWSII